MLRIFRFDNTGVMEEVGEFKKKHSVCFPPEYKAFLFKYNGGDTINTYFKINKISSDIRGLYGFGNAPENFNASVYDHSGMIEPFLAKGLFPIANDSLGNHILIGIGERNRGEIYFFDHEKNTAGFIINNIISFFMKIQSGEVAISSIEDRIKKREAKNLEVTGGLMRLWQEEIDKYSGRKQETVEVYVERIYMK